MTTPLIVTHRVELRWYCRLRDTALCFYQEEILTGVTQGALEDTRKRLYEVPFSTCPCGERIERSLHVYIEETP